MPRLSENGTFTTYRRFVDSQVATTVIYFLFKFGKAELYSDRQLSRSMIRANLSYIPLENISLNYYKSGVKINRVFHGETDNIYYATLRLTLLPLEW